MNSIVVRVSELKRLMGALVQDKMDYVQVTLLEGDAVEGMPPAAAFSALRSRKPFEVVEYDELDSVPETEAGFDLM